MASNKSTTIAEEEPKSSLVRIIHKGGVNSWLFMLSLLCLFIFLAFMLVLWVALYENHLCVFPGTVGTMCCHTNLENQVTKVSDLKILLNQTQEYNSDLKDPETVTFYYSGTSSKSSTFNLDIYYDQDIPTGGVCYPSNHGVSSGYHFGSSSGVSVYLKYYTNSSSTSWLKSNTVVHKSLSVFISDENIPNTYIFPGPANGFYYFTTEFSNSGANLVTSNATGTSPSYFIQMDTNFKLPYNLASNLDGYNPFIDFLEAKERVKHEAGCTEPNKCMCVDPGAKNLPSCENMINISGKTYFPTQDGLCESATCSYASQSKNAYLAAPQAPGSTKTKYMQWNIPQGSAILNAATQGGPSGYKDITNAIKIPGDYSGTTKPPASETPAGVWNGIAQAYVPYAIFCGSSTSGGTCTMYPGNISAHDPLVYQGTKNSRFPNAKPDSNNVVVLGHN